MKLLEGPKDNLIKELFTPNFDDCKLYRRQTAFFQPSVFKSWGESIKCIIDNETKLEILMAVSEQNFKILNTINNLQTKEEKNKLLAKEANSFFEQCLGFNNPTGDYENRRRLIRYLYAKEQLEIKLCISCDENQENLSLSHNKMGYFIDENDDYVSFMGSANESDSALMRHGEDLAVYDSKETQDYESAKKFKEALDKKWNETDPHNIVFKPTKEFIKKIKTVSNIKDKQEALKVTKEILEEMGVFSNDEIKLRDHQRAAIRAWEENGKKGILDHATGSGKTITAIKTIQALRKKIDQLVVVIGVPYVPLGDQWLDQLDEYFNGVKEKEKFIFNSSIGCYNSEPPWEIRIKKELNQFNTSVQKKRSHLSIILAVNDSLSSEVFQAAFKEANLNNDRVFVIGDECHNYSSEIKLNSLPQDARYRMGLSATAFDDEKNLTLGEKNFSEYFGGICHKYTLKDGIKDGHLCDYYYYPEPCFLDEEEFFSWREYLDKGDKSNDAINSMEDVIDNSKEKYRLFLSILKNKIKNKEHTIIFSGQGKKEGLRAIDYTADILDKEEWTYQMITAEESRKERRKIINGFERSDIKSICAIRVLDEGVDIPVIKRAIILASSSKRRQFIQRRGRVLRKNDDKDFAEIYDFVILPPAKYGKQGLKIIEREVARVEEMGRDALNQNDILNFVNKYRGLYEIA